ncbi:MAG: hypothetical protein ACI9KE_005182 [Polyangiales bacterium]|jgi:hypothetical protein
MSIISFRSCVPLTSLEPDMKGRPGWDYGMGVTVSGADIGEALAKHSANEVSARGPLAPRGHGGRSRRRKQVTEITAQHDRHECLLMYIMSIMSFPSCVRRSRFCL